MAGCDGDVTEPGKSGVVALERVSLRWTSVQVGWEGPVCGLSVPGDLYCWGEGVGTRPVQTFEGTTFKLLTRGGLHSCGITLDDEAVCWGRNEYGQLGDGTT